MVPMRAVKIYITFSRPRRRAAVLYRILGCVNEAGVEENKKTKEKKKRKKKRVLL